jgi:mono/diheme cytochrome c family protein
MIRNCLFLLGIVILLFSCTSNKSSYSGILNKNALLSQYVTIDNNKDTVITTGNGAKIKIEKGSFSASTIKLEIKEAYSIQQMVLAGLTTETNSKPLSSGGMIYINSDKDVEINKPIHISIPTDSIDNRMQLYKGEEKDGKVNWIDPKPIPKDSTITNKEGKILFENSCSTCHALDKVITGPALLGVDERGPWTDRANLHKFIHNAGAFIPTTLYTQCLQRQYGQIMPSFPEFSDKAIDAIFDYIHESELKFGTTGKINQSLCADSCRIYDSLYAVVYGLKQKKQNLIDDNGDRVDFKRDRLNDYTIDTSQIDNQINDPMEKVQPENQQSIYYKIDIDAFGWYNIDHLLDYTDANAKLSVRLSGKYTENMNVFIVIPQFKVFSEGGKLEGNENLYGFYTIDGKIPLPVGTQAYVFAIGEVEEKISFGYKEFISTNEQQIDIEPTIVTKEEFNSITKGFNFSEATIKAKDSKNADKIKIISKDLKKNQSLLEQYRPKNCNCCECCNLRIDTLASSIDESMIEIN